MPETSPKTPIPVELLDKSRHDRAGFRCGVHALESYLQRQAGQDMEKRAAVVYVAVVEPLAIAGYYTLSQFSVELTELPDSISKRFARYPVVSTTLLGRLAVADSMQGRGFGRDLLMDALWRSLRQSHYVASAAVIVDAKDERAAGFYSRYGFTPILYAERRMVLPMGTIEKMFRGDAES